MEKIWLKNYPKGVNKSVNLDEYKSFADFLDKGFLKFSNSVAFENMGKSITYKELDILSQKFSLYLTEELHMKKGDRLAIQSPNVLQYPIALFGALRSGIVVVNTNPLYTPSEMKHQFNDSGAKALVVLAQMAGKAEKVIA